MRYQRTFELHAAHFNEDAQYRAVHHPRLSDDWLRAEVLELCRQVHGHNFKIVVAVMDVAFEKSKLPWLIDDVELESIVRQWDRCNLSLHDDFYDTGMRATTEMMAHLLFKKLHARWPLMIEGVRVYETADIFATVGDVF